jgi:GntR family transcriptional regulator
VIWNSHLLYAGRAHLKLPSLADPAFAHDQTESIASDRFPVGSHLPTELELHDQYQKNRHTMRAALQELHQPGFFSRHKNARTRVESAQPRTGFRPTLASVDEPVQLCSENLSKVQSVEDVTADTVSGRTAM